MGVYSYNGWNVSEFEIVNDTLLRATSSKLKYAVRDIGYASIGVACADTELQFDLTAIDSSSALADGQGTVYVFTGRDGEHMLEIHWDEPLKDSVARFNEIMQNIAMRYARKAA